MSPQLKLRIYFLISDPKSLRNYKPGEESGLMIPRPV